MAKKQRNAEAESTVALAPTRDVDGDPIDPRTSMIDLQRQAEELYLEVEAAYGELTPELDEKLRLNALALAQKADAYAFVLDQIEGREKTLRAMRDLIDRRLKACSAHSERLLEIADHVMTLQGTEELKGSVRSLKRVKNPPSVEVIDEVLVQSTCPQAFILTEIKDAIVHDTHEPVLDDNGQPVFERVIDEETGEEVEQPQHRLVRTVYTLTLDKNALKAALKADSEKKIEGALITQGTRIETR